MNVFCDLHHGDLYESFRILFEKRLEWNLYRPIGLEWFREGYWRIAEPYGNAIDTVKQFLGIENTPWDCYKNLNGNYRLDDGIYYIYDPVHDVHQKAITLDKFKELPIDIVISSIPAHYVSFAQLIKDHKPQAKHIAHMGNNYWNTDVNNVMCSTATYDVPKDKNVVFYHQEFDLNIFRYVPAMNFRNITSFVNLLPRSDLYVSYRAALPGFNFYSYGAGCPNGTVTGIRHIAGEIQKSTFGWHVKPGGDGFGHVWHNWYACGRPVITDFNDYKGKLGGLLFEDGITGIDIGNCSVLSGADKIRYFSKPENYKIMSKNAYERFKQVVNFDNEYNEIVWFLEDLK